LEHSKEWRERSGWEGKNRKVGGKERPSNNKGEKKMCNRKGENLKTCMWGKLGFAKSAKKWQEYRKTCSYPENARNLGLSLGHHM